MKKRLVKKYKKKRGFTLIELLAVILILGIIALIAIPTVSSVVEQSRKGAAESSAKEYIKAVENKIIMKELEGVQYENKTYSISAEELQPLNLKGTLPTSGEIVIENQSIKYASVRINDYAISYDSETETYDVIKAAKYDNGTAIYFNPETGKICNDYVIENSQNKNKSGCMKWYVFLDEEYNTKINLLLDHNTTYKIAIGTDDVSNGPTKEFLNQLDNDTKNWSGVKTRKDSFSFSNPGDGDKINNYTIDYTGLKARLITVQEIVKIANMTTFDVYEKDKSASYYLENESFNKPTLSEGNAKYKWLFDYTRDCKTSGCDYENADVKGYWLAETVAYSSDRNWKINYLGALSPYDGTSKTVSYGIRPVITINKSILE